MSDWRDKVVLVTGGSAGLGRELVAAWSDAGARVIAVARDEKRLDASVRSFAERPGAVVGFPADVTCQASVEALFARVRSEFGRLDVVANNVGYSTRGAMIDTSPEEFQRLWELNFLSVVRCVRAAFPLLKASGGHVVNIGSLASKSAARYLGAYPATKSAVAAYSQQLRYEWAEQGIHVLLVCPGPLLREDAGTRYASQASGLPEAARRPGGGVRVRGIDPAWLARRILRACENRQPELVVPAKARLLFAIQQLWPTLGDWILARATRGGG